MIRGGRSGIRTAVTVMPKIVMPKLTAFLPLLAVLAFMAGCGPALEWTRPDTGLAQARLDSAECGSLARQQAFRESFVYGPVIPGPPYYGPAYYGPGYPWHGRYGPGLAYRNDFMWQARRESDLQDFCLRARGYSLTPARQPGGRS